MSPTSQQTRHTGSPYSARSDHRDPTGHTGSSNNRTSNNNNVGKLSSTTNIASDAMLLRPAPRLSSAYRRTLETHGGTQSGSIDLDTFEVPYGFTMTASSAATEKDGGGGGGAAHGRRKSGYGTSAFPSTSSTSSAVGTVPDLGEVDLSDGKNKERPQRFKAVIHFKRRETDPSAGLRQGGSSSTRAPRSDVNYGEL
ncbi:hypothetical protein FRC01_006444 [Tulasnella sp. 417]|nr:hypothetical protein FRC01_006444 [Tulasnella sp. 417]